MGTSQARCVSQRRAGGPADHQRDMDREKLARKTEGETDKDGAKQEKLTPAQVNNKEKAAREKPVRMRPS